MSGLLGSITGALGSLFRKILPSWGDPTPQPPEPEVEPESTELPEPEEEPEVESDGESDYETADEGDTSDSESESESDNESEDKIIFRRIEDPAPKRLVETRRISDQGLCVDHLAIIPETYPYREDPLATFEDVEDQISDVYRKELARLEGIKVKIVLIAHMYRFIAVGRFNVRRIDEDIAFPSEILDIIRQDRIDQTVSRQYNEILDKIDEMKQNRDSGWIYEYGKKIFLE